MNDLQCGGSEISLFDCEKSLGSQSCSHSQDVGVKCYCKLHVHFSIT